ncbi:MAG: rhomboid family intramembrane serine protease [Bacteroidetes bacterium]|nr:rhomboid family intramembrane serine protease [Bacteroidota bacterium]
MAMSYYEQPYKRRISLGEDGNALMRLIIICLAVFAIFFFIEVAFYFNYEKEVAFSFFKKNVLDWFALPADVDKLMYRPWTLLTHFFVHISVWDILGNMLWLWAFGFIMQDLTGNSKLVPVFIYGSLAGALAFVLSYNIFTVLQPGLPTATALGASAGVMAVAIATTMVAPDFRIFPMLNGGLPLWMLTLLFVIVDLATTHAGDPGRRIADVAGAFMGFLFIFLMRRGYDLSEWMNNFFYWVANLFNPDRPRKGKSVREQLYYKQTRPPYTKTSNLNQQRIDEILDKINQQGYHFLTSEEKDLLRRASEEDI